tara:strand:- start:90015 stop:91055 length:1041 start_codon:yes stop_codon:yes gene_type:complete
VVAGEEQPIAVLGAGAIGCYVGGMLQAGITSDGAKVRFIARERVVSDLSEHGLRLSRFDGPDVRVAPQDIAISTDPATVAGCQRILVCVKSQDTQAVAAQIARHISPGCMVISLQNGVDNARVLSDVLGVENVCAGMVPFNVVGSGGGQYHRGTGGRLLMADNARTRRFAAALTSCGIDAGVHCDMQAVLWGKLLLNLNNALNVLSDVPLVQQLSDRAYRLVLAAMMKEALAAMQKSDIRPAAIENVRPSVVPHILRLPNWLFARVARAMLSMDVKARSSMWDDLQKHRKPEIDYLNGAVVRLAQNAGTDAPINRSIVALVEEAFSKGQSPQLSGGQLREKLQRMR